MTDLTLNLSIPEGAQFNASGDYSIETDLAGNKYLIVREKNPPDVFRYALNLSVSSNQEMLYSLNGGDSQESLSPYLKADNDVPSDSPFFIRLAQNITEGKSTDFEKISALAQWVHEYITYDLSFADKNMSVAQIMLERRGVCGDYSLLFTTLSRSLGYPSRFVNGYAYSDVQNEWIGHAWAEVYLGKWVSVDPTWLEVGRLDATHVALSKLGTIDHRLASVSARVSPSGASLFWDRPASSGLSPGQLDALGIEVSPPENNFELGTSSQNVVPGSTFIVYLKYPASDYRAMRLLLAGCKGSFGSLLEIDNESTVLVTAPNSTYYALWVGHASTTLPQNMIYSCNLTLNSDYLELRSTKISLSSERSDMWKNISAELLSSSLSPGQAQKVFISLPPHLANSPVYAVEKNFMLSAFSDNKAREEFEFNASGIGTHTIYVFSSSTEPEILQYTVSPSLGEGILRIDYNASLSEGAPAEFSAVLDSSIYSKFPNSTLSWGWAGQRGEMPISNSGGEPVNFSFTPSSSGEYPLRVSLLDAQGNEFYSHTEPISVSTPAQVWLDSVNFTRISQSKGLVELAVGSTGPVDKIWLEVDGKQYPFTEDSLALTLQSNFANAKIVWTDPSGKRNEIPLSLKSSPPNFASSDLHIAQAEQYSAIPNYLPWLVLLIVFVALAKLVLIKKKSDSSEPLN